MNREDGFTLIELLVVMFISTLLFLGGGLALRNYWQVRSLEGAADEVQTQLRRQQERSVAESNPLVYAAGFDVGSNDWALMQYDPRRPAGTRCIQVERRSFDAGVVVQSAAFTGDDAIRNECRSMLPSYEDFVMFFARGSATPGSIVLHQPALNRTEAVQVNGITGRVDRI